MNEPYDSQTANPSIEKYVVASNNGIETHKFTRCVIGYILHGEKYVYYDDKCYKFSQGDLFFLGMGCHYTKNIPEEGHPYEQILVRFTPEELQRILLHLNITYKLNITNNHLCEKCRTLTTPQCRRGVRSGAFSTTPTIILRKTPSCTILLPKISKSPS